MREDVNEMSIDEAINILSNPTDYICCIKLFREDYILTGYELKVALSKAIDVMEETGTFYELMQLYKKD